MEQVLVGSFLTILPLTWATLRLLQVPEHLELIAGALLVFAYGFLGSAIVGIFV
ncbi:MAG TPA: hypothetical protein VGK88_10420 [bacterium]|jgi:hypothetical protein